VFISALKEVIMVLDSIPLIAEAANPEDVFLYFLYKIMVISSPLRSVEPQKTETFLNKLLISFSFMK